MPDTLMDQIGVITQEDLRNTPSPGPGLPEEIWQNMPASWAGAGIGEDMGNYILAGGTKYADRAALDLADWQAHLRTDRDTGEWQVGSGSYRNAIDAIPVEMLDKYWPVTDTDVNWTGDPGPFANPMGLPSASAVNYDSSARPSPGDPFGGWFTLAERATHLGPPNTTLGVAPGEPPPGPEMFQNLKFEGHGFTPSTNNWRLLPQHDPRYKMRGGHIIDKWGEANPLAYAQRGEINSGQSLGGGIFAPLSYGGPWAGSNRFEFWPGQLEQWAPITPRME